MAGGSPWDLLLGKKEAVHEQPMTSFSLPCPSCLLTELSAPVKPASAMLQTGGEGVCSRSHRMLEPVGKCPQE
jgi:hypothetical protein